MDAKLVVVGGDAEVREIKLRLPCILGRGRDAALTLSHPLVSRQHCELFEQDGTLVVRDLGSLNGTYIGSERITQASLRPGELLTIGPITFRAVYGDEAEQDTPKEPIADLEKVGISPDTEMKVDDVTVPVGDVAAQLKDEPPSTTFNIQPAAEKMADEEDFSDEILDIIEGIHDDDKKDSEDRVSSDDEDLNAFLQDLQ